MRSRSTVSVDAIDDTVVNSSNGTVGGIFFTLCVSTWYANFFYICSRQDFDEYSQVLSDQMDGATCLYLRNGYSVYSGNDGWHAVDRSA